MKKHIIFTQIVYPDYSEFYSTLEFLEQIVFLDFLSSSEIGLMYLFSLYGRKDFPTPENQNQIKQFLGLAGCYRRFIENFDKMAAPINQLLKKDISFNWTEKQRQAFNIFKDKLCQ